MIALPQRVRAQFLRLKKSNDKYVEIKHIKKYYFVYQSTSRWDKERKKPIKIPLYLGRITNTGEFISVKKKRPRNQIQENAQLGELRRIVEDDQRPVDVASVSEKRYKHETEILTALSMNGRISMSVLGKMAGLKETAVAAQVRKLEKKYNIKYIAEIDTTKFGYIQFLITVKFIEKLPNVEQLKQIFSEDPRVQLAMVTKGEYDLIIYTFAKSIEDMDFLVVNLRKKIEYPAIWNAAPVFEDYGFIPVREEFIDLIKDTLLSREYALLKELTRNGKIGFTKIDTIYKFDKGRSQYSYYKLKEKGIIRRITISMQNLPIKYIAAIFEDIVDSKKFRINRDNFLRNIIELTTDQVSRYLLVEDTFNPKGVLLYLPVFDNGDLESVVEKLSSMDIGTSNRTLIISSILVGNFGYREFDNAYSIQEEILVREYKAKALSKIDYEETGRIKKMRVKYAKDIRGL